MTDVLATWFGHFVNWLTDAIFALGYPGIAALMALESSFFPFPSEVVLPPAGYLAARGQMNAWLALGSGITGSLVGALFNYAVAVRLGRPLLHRYGKYLLIKEAALDRAEAFFRTHGEISTFVGRLVPVIRQYISLPAGLARMGLGRFTLYTALGASIWCAVLTWVGWYIGSQAATLGRLPTAEVHAYVNRALLLLAPLLVALVGIYVIRYRKRRRQGDPARG
jgi:membrane protein DedA with SNARE-associated domain